MLTKDEFSTIMKRRANFNKVISKWYLSTYENLCQSLEAAEKMLPTMHPDDKEYAQSIVDMIRGTKDLCDRQREEIRARYKR